VFLSALGVKLGRMPKSKSRKVLPTDILKESLNSKYDVHFKHIKVPSPEYL